MTRRRAVDAVLAAADEWLDAHRIRGQLASAGHVGMDCRFGKDVQLISPECMVIGDGVQVGRRSRIQAIRVHHGRAYEPRIRIGARTSFENDCHLAAAGSIEIGEDVLIAGGVFISDHVHDHRDIGLPVAKQPLLVGGIAIGSGSHIGEHAAVFGSVNVGEHAVIGANSVVTRDVPPLTVVAGAPARIISKFDPETARWVRVE